LNLAVSQTAKQRIKETIDTLDKVAERLALTNTCWFCKKNPAEDACILNVPMHGQVERTWTLAGTEIRYKKLQVPVPRCRTCMYAHSNASSKKWTFGIIGALAGLGGCIGLTTANNFGWGFLLLCGLFAAGVIIGQVTGSLPQGVATADDVHSFPLVQQFKREGWSIGEKPE
jgi:hypothetical protein